MDVPLPHLDRPFDYLVPAELGEDARPGTRVRVRFAGQLVDGWVLDRVAASEHSGPLSFLERLVSPEPVLSPEVAALARAVAERYAGSLADVLRLAVPPRHAGAESAPPPPTSTLRASGGETAAISRTSPDEAGRVGDGSGWQAYPAGPAFLRALADGRAPRAVWSALPGEAWPARFAEAAA
ncbi:MAG: primosome assembly protein PriA, partial [Micromonosporaceae bacterium]|nr:primosome assembly protein PriA [Micromonosporaceae bacterium]